MEQEWKQYLAQRDEMNVGNNVCLKVINAGNNLRSQINKNGKARWQRRDWNKKKWGELANKMGTIPEDIVAPNILPLMQRYFGCSELIEYIDNFIKALEHI